MRDHSLTLSKQNLKKALELIESLKKSYFWVKSLPDFKEKVSKDDIRQNLKELLKLSKVKEKSQNIVSLYEDIYNRLISDININLAFNKGNYVLFTKKLHFIEYIIVLLLFIHVIVSYFKIIKFRLDNEALSQIQEKNKAELLKLNTAIDKSQNEVLIFDSEDYKFSYVNEGAIINLGYSIKEFKTMTPLDIKPEYTLERFNKKLEPLKDGKISKLRFETVHLRKDKTTYPAEINLSKFIVKDSVYLLAIVIDLTQRKVEEKKRLKEIETSNHFLQESQKMALLGYYTYNFKTKQWKGSKMITDLMGLETEDSLQSWIDIIHPKDKLILTRVLEERLRDPTIPLDVTYRVINSKNGTIHWIHHKAQKLKRDSKGYLLPTIGIIQDITKQKEIQDKLKDSEKRWRFAIEGTKDGLWDLDLVNNVVYYSPQWKEMLGYRNDELENKVETWENLVHPKDLKRVNTLAQLHYDQKTPYFAAEYRIKCKDNTYKWILDRAKVIERDSNGKPLRIIGVYTDINERKQEEQVKEVIYNITKYAQNLPKLEDLLSFIKNCLNSVIDTTNFYVALYDGESHNFISPYRTDSGVVKKGSDFFHFPKEKSFSGYIIDTKKPFLSTGSFEKSLIKKGVVVESGIKSKCWLGVPLIAENEAIGVMVVQSYTDENKFKQKDVVLFELVASNISSVIKQSQSNEKIHLLSNALEQSPDSIMITNIEGKIEYINPAFTNLYGYTKKEAVGQTPRILKSGKQPEAFYKEMWKSIQKGHIWEKETVNKAKDGTEYLIVLTIVPVKNSVGAITHYIGIEKNITEKRQLERQFLNALIEAQETEKQKLGEELHDGISQILTAQSLYINLLINLSKNRTDDTKIYLEKVRKLNLNIAEDARNISHGLMSKQLKEGGLIKALDQICEDFNHSKSTKFNFKYSNLKSKELSFEIKTNIFRIVQEITTNIMRHAGATKVWINLTKTKENNLKLVIKDNGIGIDLKRLKRENKGAGLKNIKRRVTLLNGKMTLDTAPDKETCYTITIPLDKTAKLRRIS